MAIMDTYMIYQFIKKLVTPFSQMTAFKYGIIDQNGNFLRKRSDLKTTDEKNALGLFDIVVINLKRLLEKIPGGRSQLASYAAALILTRQIGLKEENLPDVLFNLEESLNHTMKEVEHLIEDAPMMSSGSGIVYGTRPGETIVTKKSAKTYKQKNSTEAPAILKRKPVEESTLEYHQTLNPKIWDDGQLKEQVRGKLIQIAEAWRDFAKIDSTLVQDMIITGGNVNYNYTDQSDIDLHLVINRDMINPNRSLVDEYLQDKKILWTLSHQNINIYGYPVELYAQDADEQPHFGQGVYSVKTNSWIQYPQNLNLNFTMDHHLQQKVEFYKQMIDRMIDQQATNGTFDMIKQRIRKMRGDSIAKNGEFAFGNLVFKELRNQGYLDKMDMYQKSSYDKALSLS